MLLPQKIRAALSKANIEVDKNSGITFPPGVTFQTPFTFARISQASATRLAYLQERWDWFNKNLFGSDLSPPKFILSRNSKNPKLLGWWTAYFREMGFSPQLFNVPHDKTLLGTLVHEMAHQYVSEVEKPPYHEDAHGPTWKSVMTRVGMPDDDKYYGDVLELRDKNQRKITEEIRAPIIEDDVEKLRTSEFSYARYLDSKKAKDTPVIIVGGYEKQGRLAGFNASQILENPFVWYPKSYLRLVDPIQARISFPKVFFSTFAKSKVQEVKNALETNYPSWKIV